MSISKDVANALKAVNAGFDAAFDEGKAHLRRRFTEKNNKGENILTLNHSSEWTIEQNPIQYRFGELPFASLEITGEAIDRFAELERSAPRWISVKERLPEKEGDYLCYYPHNGNITIRHCYEGDPEGFTASGLFTHWQPLPAPPAKTE